MDQDKSKTKAQLLEELQELRRQVATLEAARGQVAELEALRESERRLKLAQEIGAVGDWEFVVESQQISWSDQVYSLFERDPALGPPTYEENNAYYLPEDSLKLQENVRRAIEHGEPSDANYRLKLPSGRLAHYRGLIRVKKDPSGRVTQLLGTVQDITEHKETAEALRASEARLRAFIDHSPALVSSKDLTGKVTLVNKRFSLLAADEEEPFVGKSVFDLFPRDVAEALWENDRLARQGPVEAEEVVPHADGSTHTYLSVKFPLSDAQGNLIGTGAISTDITQRKRAEEEQRQMDGRLQRAQKLESLGALAGGIAHDLNNLLQVILGNVDLAESCLPSESKALPRLKKVTEATHLAADLASQMLAYTGQVQFAAEELNLDTLLSETSGLLKSAASKKTRLKFVTSGDLPALEGDSTQLQQILLNLVANGSEAIGDEPGEVKVETSAVECDRRFLDSFLEGEQLSEGLYVRLEVSDTGCGMDQETQARIFEPFFSTKFTGRGLGLSAVLGIVRVHRGGIKVESEPGRGTSFVVLFPACTQPSDAAPRSAAPGEWRGSGTILLADDEEEVRTIAAETLEALGFSVLEAADGVEAVRLFREHHEKIAGVVLDLKMPRMDGKQAYQELKRISAAVPVVLVSGYAEQDALAGLAQETPAGFLQKPYRLSTLRETLRQVLPG